MKVLDSDRNSLNCKDNNLTNNNGKPAFSLFSVLGSRVWRRLGPPRGDVALPHEPRPLVPQVFHQRLEDENAPRVQLQGPQRAAAAGVPDGCEEEQARPEKRFKILSYSCNPTPEPSPQPKTDVHNELKNLHICMAPPDS